MSTYYPYRDDYYANINKVNNDLATLVGEGNKGMAEVLKAEPNQKGIAQYFAHLYRDRLRYVPLFKSWLVWDGTRWDSEPSAAFPQ
jgi:hypothetical protein